MKQNKLLFFILFFVNSVSALYEPPPTEMENEDNYSYDNNYETSDYNQYNYDENYHLSTEEQNKIYNKKRENFIKDSLWKKVIEGINYNEKPKKKKEEKEIETDTDNNESKPNTKKDEDNSTNNFKFLRIIILILLIAFILFLLIKYLKFNRNYKVSNIIVNLDDMSEEELKKTDLLSPLDKAINSQDYQLAYRLMYLQTLKNLMNKSLIIFKKEFTNFDYLYQLKIEDLKDHFKQLTVRFDGVWYGEIKISKEDFDKFSILFEQMNIKIENYKF